MLYAMCSTLTSFRSALKTISINGTHLSKFCFSAIKNVVHYSRLLVFYTLHIFLKLTPGAHQAPLSRCCRSRTRQKRWSPWAWPRRRTPSASAWSSGAVPLLPTSPVCSVATASACGACRVGGDETDARADEACSRLAWARSETASLQLAAKSAAKPHRLRLQLYRRGSA